MKLLCENFAVAKLYKRELAEENSEKVKFGGRVFSWVMVHGLGDLMGAGGEAGRGLRMEHCRGKERLWS